MNILYNAEGYENPIDEYGQIYVPLKTKQTVAEVIEEERLKKQKTEKILC